MEMPRAAFLVGPPVLGPAHRRAHSNGPRLLSSSATVPPADGAGINALPRLPGSQGGRTASGLGVCGLVSLSAGAVRPHL